MVHCIGLDDPLKRLRLCTRPQRILSDKPLSVTMIFSCWDTTFFLRVHSTGTWQANHSPTPRYKAIFITLPGSTEAEPSEECATGRWDFGSGGFKAGALEMPLGRFQEATPGLLRNSGPAQ